MSKKVDRPGHDEQSRHRTRQALDLGLDHLQLPDGDALGKGHDLLDEDGLVWKLLAAPAPLGVGRVDNLQDLALVRAHKQDVEGLARRGHHLRIHRQFAETGRLPRKI